MSYSTFDIEHFRKSYKMDDVRTWPYYPIILPLKDGSGPVSYSESDEVTWEVWDRLYNTLKTFDNLYDAINHAIMLNETLIGKNK